MNYVEFITKRYIKTGKKGHTITNPDILTQRELEKQGFESIGGYSEYIYINQDRTDYTNGTITPEQEKGCFGDYKGKLKINQIKYGIDDPMNEHIIGGFFTRRVIPYYKEIVFENKSMDIDEIERAFMWFESFKSYHGYTDIKEEFHELLYEKLIETGKYKTRDFKKSIFD